MGARSDGAVREPGIPAAHMLKAMQLVINRAEGKYAEGVLAEDAIAHGLRQHPAIAQIETACRVVWDMMIYHGVDELRRSGLVSIRRELSNSPGAIGNLPGFPRGRVIAGPGGVARYLREAIGALPHEVMVVLGLDAERRLRTSRTVACGSEVRCPVHPRDVFGPLMRTRVTSVILAHNHPNGSSEPSEADLRLTRRLVEAGELLGITVADHLVVTRGGVVSLAMLARLGSELARVWDEIPGRGYGLVARPGRGLACRCFPGRDCLLRVSSPTGRVRWSWSSRSSAATATSCASLDGSVHHGVRYARDCGSRICARPSVVRRRCTRASTRNPAKDDEPRSDNDPGREHSHRSSSSLAPTEDCP